MPQIIEQTKHILCLAFALLFSTAMQALELFVAYSDTISSGVVSSETISSDTISKDQTIEEVVVDGELPSVKVGADGALVYTTDQLAKNTPVSNVIDLLEQVPFIIKTKDAYIVAGSGSTTFTINGRRTHMSLADMLTYLSNMPASRVQSIEVYFNAPPRFGVRGCVVNINVYQRRSENMTANGSLWTSIFHGNRYFQTGGTALNIYRKKWMIDISLSTGNRREEKKMDMSSYHTINGETNLIESVPRRITNTTAQKAVLGFNYDFAKDHTLEITHFYRADKPSYVSHAPLYKNGTLLSESESFFDFSKYNNITSVNYSYKNFNAGGDHVRFQERTHQDMVGRDGKTDTDLSSILLTSYASQRIRMGNAYTNYMIQLGNNEITFGTETSWVHTSNDYTNDWGFGELNSPFPIDALENQESADDEPDSDREDGNKVGHKHNVQNERSYQAFVGWTHKGKKLILTSNIRLDYFKSTLLDNNGERRTLWDKLTLLPDVNVVYTANELSAWAFSLTTNRAFPSYSVTSGRTAYYNEYMYISNSSSITSYHMCEVRANYIYKNKYIIGLFADIEPSRYYQIFHQDANKLQGGYRYYNLDKYSLFGTSLVVPQKWSSRFTSKLTVHANVKSMSGQVYDIHFDKSQAAARFILTNNFVLNEKHKCYIQTSTAYTTRSMAAYGHDHPMLDGTLSVSWKPYKTGWSFVLKCTDTFNQNRFDRHVNYKGQHFRIEEFRDSRKVNLNIRYSFNGYKEKKRRRVDTSRMGL